MKILFVSDSYFPHLNGVYYFVCRLGPLLMEKGHRVAVLAPSVSFHSTISKIDGLDVYGLPSLPLPLYPGLRQVFPFLLRSKISQIFKEFNPDIIHIQDHFLICKVVVRINRHLRIPLIGTNHFIPINITAFIPGKILKRIMVDYLWKSFCNVYNQIPLVTTPTETAADYIRPRLRVRIVAVSSGINLERFKPGNGVDEIRVKYGIPDKPVLLYVGRLDPEKRIDEIVKSVALAVKKVDFQFIVAGRGVSKLNLEKLVQTLGIADRVLFTGFVPEEDLPYFYKLSRCFIIASIAELLSLVTLQAMASGLPVIAVNEGALSELVKDGENGYLYEQGDLAAIVKAISDIFSSDENYTRMSRKSLEFVRNHDINKTLETFERLYQECISGYPLSPRS
jgi:1,2-diacylglycerol 3-alpha-glucosyltransferase